MIRKYENKRIYKNFKVVLVLSAIALGLSVVAVIVFISNRYLGAPATRRQIDVQSQIMFYLFAFSATLSPLSSAIDAKKSTKKNLLPTKRNNDLSALIGTIILSHLDLILLIGYMLIGLMFGTWDHALSWAYCYGYLVLPHLPLFFSSSFLIWNCVLIKKELKTE